MKYFKVIVTALLVFALGLGLPFISIPSARAQQVESSVGFGMRDAYTYNFPGVRINAGPIAAGTPASFQLTNATVRLPDGRTIVPFFVGEHVRIGAGSQQENVTLTAVSGCYNGAPQGNCTISGNTVNQHGQGDIVTSATIGAEEAMYDAFLNGGGQIALGSYWSGAGGTTAMIVAAPVFPNVTFMDLTKGSVQYWNPVAGPAVLATPATLTAVTALTSATPVGTFTATNYNMCIAYVDIFGQEGNCSVSFVNAGSATSSWIFTAPAASAGAVGYTIYIGLTGAGAGTLQYKVPLVTQPTVIGATPVANGVCTLTTLESVTPACAVANTTYNQSGATATVSAITVNTSPIQPYSTVISTTSIYIPNPGGRTTYTWAPGSHIGIPGLPAQELAFPITAAAGTVVPAVLGTINLPPSFLNITGKTLRVCGEASATASAATIVDIQFQWDSMGQNTAGKGVLIADQTATPVAPLATAGHATFCQDFTTTVPSAAVTGGTINHTNSFGGVGGLTLVAPGALADAMTGATNGGVGSLNLAVDSRINIIYLHTTATDGAGWILQNVSLQLI